VLFRLAFERPNNDVTFSGNERTQVGGQLVSNRRSLGNAKPQAARAPGRRRLADRSVDAEETRENILNVATREFAEKGLSGARIDEIAEQTNTSKRMIYYYFASKEGLYRAVIEREYGRIRDAETELHLEQLPALEALRQLVRKTFDWHFQNPDFVRLVMNENIHFAVHLDQVKGLQERNESVIASLSAILRKGAKERTLRTDIDPVDLHMNISALCFYTVSNRYTFSKVFGRDMGSPGLARKRREQVVEVILNWSRASTEDGAAK
jgi:AcrR family transcriptional regulator